MHWQSEDGLLQTQSLHTKVYHIECLCYWRKCHIDILSTFFLLRGCCHFENILRNNIAILPSATILLVAVHLQLQTNISIFGINLVK